MVRMLRSSRCARGRSRVMCVWVVFARARRPGGGGGGGRRRRRHPSSSSSSRVTLKRSIGAARGGLVVRGCARARGCDGRGRMRME